MKPRVLIVEDEAAIRLALSGLLRREGYEVEQAENGEAALVRLRGETFDLVLTDLALGSGPSGMDVLRASREHHAEAPVVMITAHGNEKIAVEAMKLGAHDYVPKPFDNDEIRLVVRRALERTRLERENRLLRERVDRDWRFENLIGSGAAMRRVFDTIRKVAETDLTVLVRGESGTGKELVAQALHQRSPRRERPFVAVNCAAISRELVESELFGHEKGAFTGADARRVGRFETAHGGTIFLDEIGDMPLEAQTRLLRVLQQGEYTTVGGRVPIKTDVRVIAATNRDLRQLIQQGLFREDLYYRLNVVPMRLPPLRERAEDVPDLVRHFLRKAEDEGLPAKHLDGEALDLLKHYRWPGNVRELENLIRRLAVLHSGDTIPAAAIAAELKEPSRPADGDGSDEPATLSAAVERHLTSYFLAQGDKLPPPGLYDRILQEIERPLLSICLGATRGNQIRAAHLLGLNRNTLRKKIRDLGLEVIKGLRAD